MTAESIANPGDQAVAAAAAPQWDDEATRHLSAAAHLDENFADNAIEEFLAEPRRAVPPSPGVDAAVVLREALAARRRRVLRDTAVLVLFLVILIIAPVTAVAWIAVAVVWLMVHGMSAAAARVRGGSPPGSARTGLVTATILVALLFFLVNALSPPTTGYGRRSTYRDPVDEAVDAVAPGVAVFLLLAVMLAVLLADRLALRHLLVNHFTYGRFRQPQPQDGRLDHALRASGWQPHAQRLQLIANAGQRGNLVVHDGWRAFVGSGSLSRSWSIAVRLRRDEEAGDDEEPTPLSPVELYDRVADELKRMRASDNLAPGLRLRELSDSEHVVVSARSLIRYRHEELACHILPSPASTPANWLPTEVVRGLTERSPEWIRYYRCFRVETWHKELVISSYLHIGCDERTLYVEWNAFQLNPVAPYYARGEWAEARLSNAVARALVDLVAMPGTVFRRLRTIFRVVREVARRNGIFSEQAILPSTYGSRRSIRELAAGRHGETYFHEMDGIRHVKLMERRAMAAIADCLEEHGYSTKEFSGSTSAVIHNTVINDSQVSGLNIGGRGNTVTTGNATMSRDNEGGGKD
ncbi:hypothetical protein LX15_005599 [Streptoalloteichus tenebrarius]|uniref:Uncharacterized protein n=1 Tax=Streptoalloteichus tenebrarius (strain ATCC 17920 / DSM 40477 / JCM 4838 / CBS 697.72 / NBRC 16177 / NCIMB 11028 / NRRL B-12390 / A12253. 1 / ISP 5477) TaxID=1933 RepID=A0ABT1I260_STRSD|nr:hypothetical protein [Streptoalloteichus tenebrarius]MCP2261872.1 hypothetical protein [Streptoalloteichus tenebrarius]BFF01067.1 hypothetical protein GCM10020241_27420 [Streptoalloteichus tenebrarius]